MRLIIYILLGISATLSVPRAACGCWNPLKQELSSYKGFSINFTQTDTYPFLDEGKKATGSLIVSLPDKFFWNSRGEDNSGATIVSNGKTVWLYQPPDDPRDKGQVFINSSGESVNIPSILLSCHDDDLVSIIKTGNTRTVYVAGGEDKNYKWAGIRYAIRPFRFLSFSFESPSGAKTAIISNLFKTLTQAKPAKLFEFKIPPGTRIIR